MSQATTDSSRPSRPAARIAGSLRTRLIAASVITTVLAVATMGFYVYYRSQQATNALVAQLDASIRQQAEANLQAALAEQVSVLSAFFGDMRRD